jgi:hypothetical protein
MNKKLLDSLHNDQLLKDDAVKLSYLQSFRCYIGLKVVLSTFMSNAPQCMNIVNKRPPSSSGHEVRPT